LGFAEERVHYTRSFERYALQLSRLTTIFDAARHLSVSWDVVKDIQKRNLQRRFKRIKLGHLRRIAIDEICVGMHVTGIAECLAACAGSEKACVLLSGIVGALYRGVIKFGFQGDTGGGGLRK